MVLPKYAFSSECHNAVTLVSLVFLTLGKISSSMMLLCRVYSLVYAICVIVSHGNNCYWVTLTHHMTLAIYVN